MIFNARRVSMLKLNKNYYNNFYSALLIVVKVLSGAVLH